MIKFRKFNIDTYFHLLQRPYATLSVVRQCPAQPFLPPLAKSPVQDPLPHWAVVSLVTLTLDPSDFVFRNTGLRRKQASCFTEGSVLGFVCYLLMLGCGLCTPGRKTTQWRTLCPSRRNHTPGPGRDASWYLSASFQHYQPDHLAKMSIFSTVHVVTICPPICGETI